MDFEPHKFYRPNDDELRIIAAAHTLCRWRHEGTGPRYIKAGSRVLYQGKDLLDWLNAQRVEPSTKSSVA